MNLQGALQAVLSGAELSKNEAREVFGETLDEDVDPVVLAGLLSALAMRGERAAEIAGAAEALRDAMVPFEHGFEDALDTCGTGGDGLGSFNLSTAAAVVCAGAGARVIKHGNRSLSSKCGSADLLEEVGVQLELSPAAARDVLEEAGITFLFAPLYHPALRFAGPVRRGLGVRTLFNFLGPLVNPGRVRRQLLGVPDGARVEILAAALAELGHERAYVVHGAGGADELTLAGENRVHAVGRAPACRFDAAALGLAQAPAAALEGGDARRNAQLLGGLLSGEPGPLRDATLLNAAAALVAGGLTDDPAEALERAREAVDGGAARDVLERWVATSKAVAS